MPEHENNFCEWAQDDFEPELWEAECLSSFVLNAGAPSENDMKYCCFCGKELKELPHRRLNERTPETKNNSRN